MKKNLVEKELSEGAEIEGFVVNRIASIPEFNLTAIRLKHAKTGTDYLHLARDDSNNVFSVGFRTTPTDSTGLPHILEHTTLCGSQKYPCRDPFFKMLNRSLATFMNAMTGPDYTIYPFSTQNKADYANLQSVYLDAVFKPQLRESDFRQEGWRLEHEKVEDQSSPIIIKGVVYNEMKGVFSENQSIFGEGLINNILPSHTYGVISGGDPLYIPDLTYSDLKAFHKKYYHPSNSRMYSYGNFPLTEHLHFINKAYLQEQMDNTDYSKATIVPAEPRWSSEKRKHLACRFDPLAGNPKKQSSIAISNLCVDIRACQEVFVLQVLSELLVRGPNSPFYKALVEPNIGSGFSPVTGFDGQTRDTVFAVGLQGVSPSDFERVEEIYHKTIDKVINDGFDDTNLKAILHNIELNTKHQSSDFGLSMLFGITPLWNHNGDIIKGMQINEKVMKLKRSLADNPLYLQDCVAQYIKENNHRLILTMSPEESYETEQSMKEKELLKKKLDSLLPLQRDHIYAQGIELSREQEAKQDVNCLPTLTVSDLNHDVQRTDTKGELIGGVPVQIVPAPTNGLTYVRGVLNVSVLSESAKALLPLFCDIAPKMGTKSHDYRQFDQMVKLRTGGLNLSPHIAENIFDSSSFEEGVVFSSYCLDRNFNVMVSLWKEIFSEVNLENEKRFETLVKVTASNMMNGVADSGHVYAMSCASALVSPSARRKDQFGGLSYVQLMKELAHKSYLVETLEMMQNIKSVIFRKKYIRTCVNTQPDQVDKLKQGMEDLFSSINGNVDAAFLLSNSSSTDYKTKSIHHVLPYNVYHTAMCFPTVEYSHSDFPALRVLARLLSSKYLLPKVREKGGAYGAGANVTTAGVFNFYSYRDPKPSETFDVFNSARDWVLSSGFTEQDVDEAKLGVFQSIDAPTPPGSRGTRNFLYGIDDDELQRHRVIIKGLKKNDLIRVADHLTKPLVGRCLLGPPNNQILQRTDENWEVKRTD